MAKRKRADVAVAVAALMVPDPSASVVPVGWWEATAMPVIEAVDDWDALDDVEAQLLAAVSFIASKGGDDLELQKAMRVVDYRRGILLGEATRGRPKKNVQRDEHFGGDLPRATIHNLRLIAKHWRAIVLPILRDQTKAFKCSQRQILASIARRTSGGKPKVPAPTGAYHLLYADPPWRYEHVETDSRAIENQYPTLSLADICALKVPAADDAVLYLWATPPKLAEALAVIEAWDFNYRTGAVWDKEVMGMGYYFRQQHEHLLVAVRGNLPVPEPSNRPASVFRVKRTDTHSAKPPIVYRMLERMYPGFGEDDRIELFARGPKRAGWSAWGNDVEVEGVLDAVGSVEADLV